MNNLKKKILLIIDPQNDFTPYYKNSGMNNSGSLAVNGSIDDYKRIIKLIDSDFFNEIHISLDTHTKKHIGHKDFYINGYKDRQPFTKEDANNVLEKNDKLKKNNYFKKYFTLHTKYNAKRPLVLWPNHCIEGTNGHKIYKPLQDKLNQVKNKIRVRYHIKGQNDLTEMYSIFSALVDPREILGSNIPDNLKYSGSKTKYYNKDTLTNGLHSYREACKYVNLNTKFNTYLLSNLFGDNNQIYVCGQARSHCVKDSMVDLFKYANKNNIDTQNIISLIDCTSPVIYADGKVADREYPLDKFVKDNGGTVINSINILDLVKQTRKSKENINKISINTDINRAINKVNKRSNKRSNKRKIKLRHTKKK